MTNQTLDIIKQTIEEILRVMSFSGRVTLDDNAEGMRVVNIETDEAAYLIGQGGANLMALEQVAKRLVNQKIGEAVPFVLDINNYRQHRTNLLKELARQAAERVLAEGRNVVLQPMNAYERRIVHLALAAYSDLSTLSEGEEPQRKIVIKPNLQQI